MDGALEAVRLAIAMEEKAARFYREAAQQTDDLQARAVLQSFAEDEDKHGQLLSSLAESYYLKQGRFDIPELKPTEYQDRQPGPIFCKRLEELASHPQPVAAAVDKFAQAESEAIELYQKLSRDSAEPEIAAFFAKLVDWERRHLDLLQKQAAAFNSQKP